MKLLNNPEIKRTFLIYIAVTLISSLIFVGINLFCSAVILIMGFIYIVIFLISSYRRYKAICEISTQIDSILHNSERIELSDFSEGELSVLRDEVFKLTIALRQQTSELTKEKVYLTDSIADISHQIRTPLTSLNLIVSMLAKADLTDERRYELVKQLKNLLSHIDWLISALLMISKLDANTANMTKRLITVSELIHSSVEPLEVSVELRGQKLEIEMNGDESFIGDLKWTVEAVENIVKNCMEHTPQGGTIKISSCENAIYTEIKITDNGTGIDKEDLPHLFERFYKGKDSSDQSVGIGLALARMIVTSQNGTVKAENNKESGASFTIRFYKGAV